MATVNSVPRHSIPALGMTLILLLFLGCNPGIDNKRDMHGYAEIHTVVRSGDVEVAEKLIIESGAKVNNTDADGLTPLHHAVKSDDLAMTKLLLQYRGDPTMTTKKGWDAVHLAAWRNNTLMLDLVLSYGGIINRSTPEGWTALHMAAWKASPDLIDKLLMDWSTTAEFGKPDVNQKDQEGRTPLLLAMQKGNLGVCSTLLRKGADVNVANKDGDTPLHLLAGSGNVDLAQQFILSGAKLTQYNGNQKTPFDMAMEKNDEVLARFLWANAN